jgi:Fe-S-cluster containining protein
MDGKSMGFLQKEAGKAVADCFATGLSPENLLNCSIVQLQFYEAMQKSLLGALPPEQPFKCGAGCSACCHRKVACTIPEAIGIAAWLSEREEAEKLRIRESARRLHDETAALDDEKRIAGGLPCALLADGVCSVYEARPLTCRAMYSYDRAACERFYFDHDFATAIPHYDLMLDAHAQMLLGYGRALEKLGLDGRLVELSSALLLLLDEPDAVTRYLAGEQLFEPARYGRR